MPQKRKRGSPRKPQNIDKNSATLVKNRLSHSLSRLHTGSFASSQVFSQTPIPHIFINSTTQIGLPLTDKAAKDICKDGAIEEFEFEQHNPEWEEFVEGLKPSIASVLGIPGDSAAIQIKPHQMLLHKRGVAFQSQSEYGNIFHFPHFG
jgi:hypothetical protein